MSKQRGILLLTNCTGRKRHPVASPLTVRGLSSGSYDEVATQWVSHLRASAWRHPVNTLYCGRVVTEVYAAAELVGAEVAFVSAGLGLVSRYDEVPAYNLTASPGNPDSIECRISGSYDPRHWWTALNSALGKPTPLRDRLSVDTSELILVAMPASYLMMTKGELESLPEPVRDRMRIMGPRRQKDLPDGLQKYWMPYDARLNSKSTGFSGTESDFPHRAVHHFVQKILQAFPNCSAVTHREAVLAVLAKYRAPKRTRGVSATDQELLMLLRRIWSRFGGGRTQMLRELRGVRKIACEQSRFRRLADQIEAEIDAENTK